MQNVADDLELGLRNALAHLRASTRLGCDGCTLCCELIGVPEIDKPRGDLCQHACVGEGCRLHTALGGSGQPESCEAFYCAWLSSQHLEPPHRMPPSMRPDRCHVVFGPCDDQVANKIYINVDPKYPDSWREPEVLGWLTKLKLNGNEVIIFVGDHSAELKIGRRPL